MTDPAAENRVPRGDASAPDGEARARVLDAVVGACSIDAVATRVGAVTIKDVLAVKRTLRELAADGTVRDMGGGMWARGISADEREPVTSQDVLFHGFGDGAGPATLQRIADNVEAATGRDAGRIADVMALLLDMGKVEPSRSKCFVLTERAMAEIDREGGEGAAGVQARVLELVPAEGDVGVGDIVRSAVGPHRLVQASLRSLVEAGVLVRIDGPRGRRYARTGDAGDELSLRVRMSGPALRRAFASLQRPMSQKELAAALGVTRERARQIANTLVERGLARSYERRTPNSGLMRFYVAAPVPEETPLEDRILAAMPRQGLVDPVDVAAATSRHPADVASAIGTLLDRGALVAVTPEARRTLYGRDDAGSPSLPALPVARLDMGQPIVTLLSALSRRPHSMPDARDVLEKAHPGTGWDSETTNSRLATLRRAGITGRLPDGDGLWRHTLTDGGARVLKTLRLNEGGKSSGAKATSAA